MNRDNLNLENIGDERVVGLVRKTNKGFCVDCNGKLGERLGNFIQKYQKGVSLVYSPFMNEKERADADYILESYRKNY
ncbi:MAG: hypothetical protein ACOC1P_04630 [Minisyncoccales bacterium]